jgi:predicted acylesterase/phospholipase RssA
MKAFGVFEGGGAKGYAHVGALKAIEARGIELEAVAGSSIGAVIALLISAGFTADELFQRSEGGYAGLFSQNWISCLNQRDWEAYDQFRKEYLSEPLPAAPLKIGTFKLFKIGYSAISAYRRHNHLFDQIWSRFGVTDAEGFRNWLDNAVRKKLNIATEPILFRHLKPLKIIAGDLVRGKMVVFGKKGDGDLCAIDAVVASASYPIFFQPYPFRGSLYFDGGLLSNLPAWVFDDERLAQPKPIPTFGFRFADPLLAKSPDSVSTQPASFPAFVRQLVSTSIFGSQELGARGIEEYYPFDLPADIDTLAFHEIEEKAVDLVEAGRKAVIKFFDSQIGPSDPDVMEIVLSVLVNFVIQAFDKLAKKKLRTMRSFVLIKTSEEFLKVAYSANASEDADDRLKIRTYSPGAAECFTLKEPILTFVPKISEALRTSAIFKYEHAARPKDVVTVYAIPVFLDPNEWSKDKPEERSVPIAALTIDSVDDIRDLLQRPELEDRLATYAQICGEYLRGVPVKSYGPADSSDRGMSELIELKEAGFSVSSRKSRFLFQDSEAIEFVERIEARIP